MAVEDKVAAGTQLSADGNWWWDGERWVPALSPDGLWHWNGEAWKLATGLDSGDPAALAEGLDRLVDARFAEAGHSLALRAHEWRPRDPELADLVLRAAPLAARLAALDNQLAGLEMTGGLLGLRQLLGGGEREQLEAEARGVEAELRPLAALIGRMAPQPSLKEADEILVSARRLSERVVELNAAVAEERRLAGEREQALSEARSRVEQAREQREAALRELEDQVRAREHERARAVDDLARALRSIRVRQAGDELARFHDAVVYESRVDTPDGRGPLDGAQATLGTAAELWESDRETVDELALLEAAQAARFHDALVDPESGERFLLIKTGHVRSLLAVGPETEAEATEFAAELARAARGARRRKKEWEAQVTAAEAALQAAGADTAAVDEARSALETAAADPELNRRVEAAEAALEAASAPRSEQAEAARRVAAIAERLLEPPPPLA